MALVAALCLIASLAASLLPVAPAQAQAFPTPPAAEWGSLPGSGAAPASASADQAMNRSPGGAQEVGGPPGLPDIGRGIRELFASTISVAEFTIRLREMEWQEVAWEVFKLVLLEICRVFVEHMRQVINQFLTSKVNVVTETPAEMSYRSQTVQGLWVKARNIANAGIFFVAVWGGVNVMVQHQLGSPYHTTLEFLPRLAVGAVLANTSLGWTSLLVELNNLFCRFIGGAGLPGLERLAELQRFDIELFLAVVYYVVGLLLLAQMLLRLALVNLLIVVSPLAMLMWVLPQTQGWSRQWSSTFTGTVFTQFVQVTSLHLGGSLLAELQSATADAKVVTILAGIATICLTFKVPGLMNAYVGDGLGFVRYLTFQAATRALLPRR